eukprot:TRINITY_DN23258_c0_g1_i1.p1 TRINITY_DN23258_c0_g1~~TRINITY_DN23258_c0_g1_i1.p1  ORF type:complete len:875 (+),score=174.01 TRINITY_DN23258_c0_g1_i1:65-2626(+)
MAAEASASTIVLPAAMSTKAQPVMQCLPREILRWIQSLDLSYSVRNVKRDFANGFLIAEIFSRYFPQEISMHTFENGSKLSCKADNWEQLFRFYRKRNLPISKSDFEPVMEATPGSAVALLVKIYTLLTSRTVPIFMVEEPVITDAGDGGYSGSKKNPDSATLLEPPDRGLDSMDLGLKDGPQDAYKIFQAARSSKPVERSAPKAVAERDDAVPLNIAEVKARSLTKNVAQLRAQQAQVHQANLQKSRQTNSVTRKSSGGPGNDDPSTPSLGFVGTVKPAADVMRPIVAAVLQENDQVMKSLDPRKDVVVSFMELCRTHIPEAMCVRVFDGLSSQANQLVDTLVKSPSEFWRVWTLYCPAMVEFSESSPVFESVVYLFKRIGNLLGEVDPVLTQQLITDVGLPSLAPLLIDSAGKREPLCELVYSYTQPSALSRLGVLRALKEAICRLPVYIACLSYFVPLELEPGILEEHLLEHYMYYALVALQSPEPKIRVAGLSILVTASGLSGDLAMNVLTHLPSFALLTHDTWWEVQAQLLLLASRLLTHLSGQGPPPLAPPQAAPAAGVEEEGEEGEEAAENAPAEVSVAPPEPPVVDEETIDSLLFIVSKLFGGPSTSKIVLQVGLCSLVKILRPYPSLLPAYASVLLQQPHGMRQRLLQLQGPDGEALAPTRRLIYVMGTSSRLYEEMCIAQHWPALEIARTLAEQAEESQLPHFEPEHLEVLTACLPGPDVDIDDEWLAVFEKVKAYIFVALVDPALHQGATDVVRRFWLCQPQNYALMAIGSSKKTLLQTLRVNYSDAEPNQARVDESELLGFLREMRDAGGAIQSMLQTVVDQFREAHNAEFQHSNLDTLFE